MGFDILLTEDASKEDLNRLETLLNAMPFTQSVVAHTPEEAAANWEAETGENVEELLGVNPFVAELEVRVKADWASSDSLQLISQSLDEMPVVAQVNVQADLVDSINSNISTIAVALSVIALALLFISFVLINNTVRLTVYARRFIIHTMKLVGATKAFIRRPFIVNNILQGLIAGIVAICLLWGVWYYISTLDAMVAVVITPADLAIVFGSVIIAGVLICSVAAWWAANRYLSLTYDEMFS